MLKIPELPIYNTERYTNFNPISPEDFVQGQIYTNDKLVIYITHLSFNKTASYLVWNNEGEYVGEEMFSSQNIYAIVTFLNNNNFRLLDYELEVINPFNTNEKILLTPNGTKKIKNTNEMYAREKITKLMENCIRRILKEGVLNDIDTYNDEEQENRKHINEAQDFGLRRNQDFKGKQSDNKCIKSQMSDAEWKEYMNNRISHMQDYLNRHYPKRK